MSFYWAAGGTVGIETLAASIQEEAEAREPGFVALTWATGGLKVLGGLLALALVRPWGRALPRRVLLVAAYAVGVGIVLYRAAALVEAFLAEIGAIDVPAGLGEDGVRWALFFWEPFWLLGGILFLLAARGYHQAGSTRSGTASSAVSPR
jgi:hypothetical protein